MRRSVARRIIISGALALLLLAGFGGLRGLHRYVYQYDRSRFRQESVQSLQPSCYYLDWRQRWASAERLRGQVAVDGVVRSVRDRWYAGELRHNPLRVIQVALAVHDLLLDEPTPEREAFFRRQLEWLAGAGLVRTPRGIPVWPHYDAFDRYGLEGPWISALTQGQAISLLVRASQLTGEECYLRLAGEAAQAFRDPDLPLVWVGPDGARFFEEFPCEPVSHALNGCLLAWLGLWDLARACDDASLRQDCLADLRAFEPLLERHEIGDWTRYDLLQQRPTSPAYHELHAALAEALAAITGQPAWHDRAARWRRSAQDPAVRWRVTASVLVNKICERVRRTSPPQGIGCAACAEES